MSNLSVEQQQVEMEKVISESVTSSFLYLVNQILAGQNMNGVSDEVMVETLITTVEKFLSHSDQQIEDKIVSALETNLDPKRVKALKELVAKMQAEE